MDGWYYKIFSIDYGPVSKEKLIELIQDRSLSRTDEVRFGERGTWRQIGSIGPLMAHLPFESNEKVIVQSASISSHLSGDNVPARGPVQETEDFDIEFANTLLINASPAANGINGYANLPNSADAARGIRSQKPEGGWFCIIQGDEYGPVELSKLIEFVQNGVLSRNDEVRFGDKGNWRRIGSIGPLMAHLPFETNENVVVAPSSGKPTASSDRNATAGKPVMEDQDSDIDFGESVSLSESRNVAKAALSNDVIDSVNSTEHAKSPAIESLWWCKIQGKEYGPVELPKLIDWSASGRLRGDDHVRFGLDPYVRADELPGLFPERQKTTNTETKSDSSTRSELPLPQTSKPTTPESSVPAKPPARTSTAPLVEKVSTSGRSTRSTPPQPTETSLQVSTTKPVSVQKTPSDQTKLTSAPSMSGTSVAKAKAPAPIQPQAKSSFGGGGKLAALLPIGLGIGAVSLVGVLIFVAIQFIPANTVEEVRRYKALREGYSSFLALRDAGVQPSPESLKAARDKIIGTTKAVNEELKKIEKRTPIQDQIKSVITKMRTVANTENFDEKQKSKFEVDLESIMAKLEKDLGLK